VPAGGSSRFGTVFLPSCLSPSPRVSAARPGAARPRCRRSTSVGRPDRRGTVTLMPGSRVRQAAPPSSPLPCRDPGHPSSLASGGAGRAHPSAAAPSTPHLAPGGASHVPSDRLRRRSMGFLERDEEQWACYLVTFQDGGGGWKGYFAFRPGNAASERDEIHTAHIFIEEAEAEIDRKARGLGRPLLTGLLSSALHTRERAQREAPALRNWFRDMLRKGAGDRGGDLGRAPRRGPDPGGTPVPLRLLPARPGRPPHHPGGARPLSGGGKPDPRRTHLRLQHPGPAPVRHDGRGEPGAPPPPPPFERWAEDYLAHPEVYRAYAHALHREGSEGVD
jgi:hypothetical protein